MGFRLRGWVSGFTGCCVQEYTICRCTLSSKMYEDVAMYVYIHRVYLGYIVVSEDKRSWLLHV